MAHFYDFLRYGKSVDKKEKTDDAKICADLDKMSLIIFTSGTTGTSKGVMLSQRNVLFCVHAAAKLTEVTGDDVLLSALPFHHTYEMTAGILTGMLLGCTICINEKLTSLLSDFKIYKPTAMAMVPLMVNTINKKIEAKIKKEKKQKLVDAAAKVSNVLSGVGINVKDKLFKQILEAFGGRLKKIVCGGAALNPTLVKRFRNYGISIKQGYGITECAPVISLVPYDVFNPDSCGMLLEGMQIMIDKISPDDKTGEILVKGDNVMLGYYKNEQATNAVLWGGWFATGDCGYVDSDNFIYITGRKKNVIVLANGKNVFPEEIEEYLEKIEFVSECCVVARTASDDKENIKLSAIIYPDYEGLKGIGVTNEEEVKGFFKDKVTILNKSLASFKQINIIEVRQKPFVKTTTQKIQRHKIDEE